MPPKAKKPERKSLTKGDKAKKHKEEAERKAREEEESRIKAEREDAERKERERIEAEEMRRMETEERGKRKGQLAELDAIVTNNYNNLYAEKLEARKATKWARYMRCDGSPDPSNLGEINMYLTLWKEDVRNIEFEVILKEAALVLQLIDELEFLLGDTMDYDLTDEKKQQHKETIFALQDILNEKLDLGTHDLMLKASGMAAPDTNLIKIIGNDIITLCLWANLTKNPRSKSFDFDSKGMVFELNPALNRADCGVRVLFTKFDHLSHQSKSFYPRIKIKEPEPVSAEATSPDGTTESREGLLNDEATKPSATEVVAETQPGTGRPPPPPESDVDSEIEKATEEASKAEEGSVAGEEEDVEDEVIVKTPEVPDYDDFDGDEDEVDLRGFHVVGGIFHIDLCELPPQPKVTNKWQITLLVNPPKLHYIDYVAEKEQKTEETVEGEPTANKEVPVHRDKKEKDIEKTPVMVTLRLPEEVCFCEEPQVARWDYKEKVWKTDGILDKVYNEAGRQLTFRLCKFGTMALLQDSHINMPFQSWELRPRGSNHAQLTIIAAVLEVEFQIKSDLVCLSQPVNKPELAHLINKWMSLRDLVTRLRESGVNVFPAEDSFKYVKIPDKNPLTEDRLYRQMSLVGSVMAFSWSRWNLDVNDREKIIIQGAEHLKDEPLLEEDWSLFQITKRRTTKLKMTEYGETFSADHAEGSQFHADLYHMTMDIVHQSAKERINETNANFSENVYNLLSLTRVVPYS